MAVRKSALPSSDGSRPGQPQVPRSRKISARSGRDRSGCISARYCAPTVSSASGDLKTRSTSCAAHDLGIPRQGLHRVVDMMPIGGVHGIEPVACGLEGHAEMHSASLAAGKAADHQQGPPAQELLAVGGRMAMGATGSITAASPTVESVGRGHLTARAFTLRRSQCFQSVFHESSLGWTPMRRVGEAQQAPHQHPTQRPEHCRPMHEISRTQHPGSAASDRR